MLNHTKLRVAPCLHVVTDPLTISKQAQEITKRTTLLILESLEASVMHPQSSAVRLRLFPRRLVLVEGGGGGGGDGGCRDWFLLEDMWDCRVQGRKGVGN